jgi:hypothetical protein
MLRDRRDLVVTFADKAAVRDHVAVVIGESYLPRVYAILDSPRSFSSVDLPEAYVVKPTHGSGAAIIVSSHAPGDARLPDPHWGWVYCHVRPEFADPYQIMQIAEGWVTKLYGQGPNREWVYGQVPRRVIVEEMLVSANGTIPDDYKFFVFHGRCAFIQVDSGRFDHRTQDFYRRDWQRVPMSGGPPWADPEPARPEHLDEMIRLAERLGQETDFVRVDLYDVDGRVVFGELTSFPAGGDSPFTPEMFNTEFGRPWAVPRRYR